MRFCLRLIGVVLLSAALSRAAKAETKQWTLVDGTTLEGTFITIIGTDSILRTPKGSQVRIPMERFSEEDVLFIELSCPPKFEVDFIKNLDTVVFSEGYYGQFARQPERHGNFGIRVKQTSAGHYRHALRAEMYVVAQQLGVPDRKCFLLDRQDFTFHLTKENKRSVQFMSDRMVRLQNWNFRYNDSKAVNRGEIYYGYLIVIMDSRGEVIHIQGSRNWFEEHAQNLRKLRIGNFFDDECNRCFPGRPVPLRWG